MTYEDKEKKTLLDQADHLIAQKRYQDAAALLAEMISHAPDDESVMLRLAWTFWDMKDKEQSIFYWEQLFERELSRRIFTGFAFDELARIHKQENRPDLLVALCRRAVAAQPDDIGILTEMGNACLLAKQFDEAHTVFARLTELETDNPVFFCKLGEALFANGLTHQAESAFRQACRIDPDDADRYLFQAADLHRQFGDIAAAKRLIRECLEISPEQGLYHCALGDLLIGMGRVGDARAAYEQAICRKPDSAAAYCHRLGHSLMEAKYYSEAMAAFSREVSLQASPSSLRALAEACEKAGEMDLADQIRHKI